MESFAFRRQRIRKAERIKRVGALLPVDGSLTFTKTLENIPFNFEWLMTPAVHSGTSSSAVIITWDTAGFRGAQLRYFVDSQDGVVALLAFSAAAWRAGDRDNYIGWDEPHRKKNLHLVVSNSRFLILPWIHSKGLASRVLSLAARRLPADWQARYNYRPVLLETFVERDRFKGTCYKAAGWTCVGETKGRGKLDIANEYKLPVKTIWIKPLEGDFSAHLCGGVIG